MRSAIHRIGDALGWCGAAVLVLVSFPFLAVAIVILRTVLAAVLAAAILGALALLCVHSPFRQKLARPHRS